MARPEEASGETAPSNSLVGGGSGTDEARKAVISGILFGLTSATIGHPFDTVKTKMQAQSGYASGSALRTVQTVVRTEGVMALWRGLPAPLAGSAVFRSLQFGAYSSVFAGLKEQSWATTPLPGCGGLEARVVLGGMAAGTTRALIETPLELIKVRRQTGQAWRVHASLAASLRHPGQEARNLYANFPICWVRATGLLGSFFVMVDSLERSFPDQMNSSYGPFIKGGLCATAAWLVVWPFELLKNQAQAGTAGVDHKASLLQRARHVVAAAGSVRGLYRGLSPGVARSVVANGTSMMVFAYAQRFLREGSS